MLVDDDGGHALVTIVMVPREKHALTGAMIDRLLSMSTPPFELVVVDDVRAPRKLRRWLTTEAARVGFRHIELDHAAGVNEARMAGFTAAHTPYVIFMDNDVWLHDGAVDALLSCADETDASCVAPVYCLGRRDDDMVHHACGGAEIITVDGRRRLRESQLFHERRLRDVRDQMHRQQCESVELHCALVRTESLREAGGLDTRLASSMDCLDLAFRMQDRAAGVWFEPSAVVTYDPSSPRLGDLSMFLSRWSARQINRDIEQFASEWDLDPDDPWLDRHRYWLGQRRWKFLGSFRRVARTVAGRRGRRILRRTADAVVNRTVGR
jgi:GT2 family glycosyltransferase